MNDSEVVSDGDTYNLPFDDDARGPWPPAASEPQQLTLALLEDLAAVLMWHGYPPLRGYALAELAGSHFRIGQRHS